jgi:hypothetical protein
MNDNKTNENNNNDSDCVSIDESDNQSYLGGISL